MWCFNRKILIPFLFFFLLGLFVYGSRLVGSTKVIIDNRAQDISPSPTPSLAPKYPSEYGVKFEESNSKLPVIQKLVAYIAANSVFQPRDYWASIPSTFRLGLYPRESENTVVNSFTYQTNIAEYSNMTEDLELKKYFNFNYPILGDHTSETGGIPIKNFCHLASLANVVKAYGLENAFINVTKPQLEESLQEKDLSLAEVIFYKYYRSLDNNRYSYKIGRIGVMDNDLVFTEIANAMIDDINLIDKNKYQFNKIENIRIDSKKSLTLDSMLQVENNIKIPNSIYVIRTDLNNYRYAPSTKLSTKGPAHYLVVADAKSFTYPKNATDLKKTVFFVIDSLGKTKTFLNQSYNGMGYIGWTGMSYFHGDIDITEKNVNKVSNDSIDRRIPGIYNLFLIRNTKAQPTPTVSSSKPNPKYTPK